MAGAAPEQLDLALRALADANRRIILDEIRARPRAVGDIAERVDMSQQAVSHHLSVLRDAGLVEHDRDGTRHLYAVRSDGLRVVEEYVSGFWPAQLKKLKQAAETTARRRSRG